MKRKFKSGHARLKAKLGLPDLELAKGRVAHRFSLSVWQHLCGFLKFPITRAISTGRCNTI
jgi:hypothetical protein